MRKHPRKSRVKVLRTAEERRAVASPLRMELLGLFVDGEPRSVAQIGERMGRPATAIHYHVQVLEKVGILRRVGRQRAGRRPEALHLPAADMFKMADPLDAPEEVAAAALKTMSTAFRMAERDMKAALTNPSCKTSGLYRNAFGARIHCRLSKKGLADLNRHLRAIEKMMTHAAKDHEPSPGDSFLSLTLALMPLRNREVQP